LSTAAIFVLFKGALTGPSPVDRGRTGSKHHLIVERPRPGWDTLAGGRTERWAAAGINAGGAFLIFFLGDCGARSPGPGASAVVPCGCGGLAGRVRAGRHRGGRSASHRAGADELLAQTDGVPDPGEVVWTWVPFEENDGRGKDRPVLVVAVESAGTYLAVQLTSKDHDGEGDFVSVGAGGRTASTGRPGATWTG
jgi:hypothetical protein